MSYPTPDNPHTQRFDTHELVWWCGNTASGPAGADRVQLFQYVEREGRYSLAVFEWPAQQRDLKIYTDAFARAFEFGRIAKAKEIRKALDIDT